VDLIHLVAPTSPPARMRMIARATRGFVYLVSLTGVAGARAELPPELQRNLRALRAVTTRPICVGFGIGTPAQAAAVAPMADGIAVGSAVVQLVERHGAEPDRLLREVGDFIAALKAPLRTQ
jgi:tryptophan synthase alpha chain